MDDSKTVYSVSELTKQIKVLLEDNFPTLWVEGEISNYKKHYSGHYYFTLKDPNSQISCVMWKSRTFSTPFKLEDGMRVHIFGNIRLYEKSGRYQLDAILLQQAGVGELQLKFENLKKQLHEEGLFDEKYKKSIPKIPQKIGIITSPTGAAIKDIISVINRRFPVCEILIRGVKVQGISASNDISEAIIQMNEIDDIDLIILGRGGGSLEDLWAFNEENVAKTIFASKIPIISAVGHEIDYTISDFVSDLRAPTPSVAAELAVPDKDDLIAKIRDLHNYITSISSNFILNSKIDIRNFLKSYAFKKPEDMLHQYFQRLDDLLPKLIYLYSNKLSIMKTNIENLVSRLSSLHPDHVLSRGYAIIQKEKKIVRSVKELEINDNIDVQFIDGKIISTVREKEND
ncbi:MAG: exodeoxyribonuclease VII large subunit [Calditrichia bacterium]|nr:exodeoxyribonuclease VII large subunit [Calditrichia bacterium]